jgi:hypothetical protein
MPRTLVHGDFVGKNCRVRNSSNRDPELVVFDWEKAGWGVPAVDLATNAFGVYPIALDRELYAAAMADAWPGLGRLELEQAVRIGDAQRVIAAIRWGCAALPWAHQYPWIVQEELRLYLLHLRQAVRLLRGNDLRRSRREAARAEGLPKVVS